MPSQAARAVCVAQPGQLPQAGRMGQNWAVELPAAGREGAAAPCRTSQDNTGRFLSDTQNASGGFCEFLNGLLLLVGRFTPAFLADI